MENELNRLIEAQNNEVNKYNSDDDKESMLDIDEFEERLKKNRSMMGYHDDDSDEENSFSAKKSNNKAKPTSGKIGGSQVQKKATFSFNDEPDLLKQVQNQKKSQGMSSGLKGKMTDIGNEINKYKQEAKPKSEEDKLVEILNSGNTGLKDKKLKELIQKNKELYVSMEKEKNMRQKLQKELDKMKEENELQIAAMEGRVVKTASAGKPEEDWKKKYNEIEKRFQEVKLQNSTLKNELNKAMRVISREIGENVNIDQILTENNWKGRQQQIEVLKVRVKDLQGKLGTSGEMSYMNDKSQSDIGGLMNDETKSARGGSVYNQSATSNVGGKAKERREEIESLKIQVEALKAENDALNDKVKAVSSRKGILEKDVKEIKSEFERNKLILMEKSENDNKYISALKKEVERLKASGAGGGEKTRIVYRDRAVPVESKKNEVEELEDNIARKELILLKNELDKKEKIIKELISDKVRSANMNVGNTAGNKENWGHEGGSDPEKIVKLETLVKILKQENEELSCLKLGVKTTTPDSKIIKDLSLQNAQLRRKLDDLQQKLKSQ